MLPVFKKATFSKKFVFSSLALVLASAWQPTMAQEVTCAQSPAAQANGTFNSTVVVSGSGTLNNECLGTGSSDHFTITASTGNGIELGKDASITSVNLSGNTSQSSITANSGYGIYLKKPSTSSTQPPAEEGSGKLEVDPPASSTAEGQLSAVTLNKVNITAGEGGFYTNYQVSGAVTVSGSTFKTTNGSGLALMAGAQSVKVNGTSTIESAAGNGITLAGTFGTAPSSAESPDNKNTGSDVISISDNSKVSGNAKEGNGLLVHGKVYGNIKVDSSASVTGFHGIQITSRSTVSGNVSILGYVSDIYNLGTITGDVTTSNAANNPAQEDSQSSTGSSSTGTVGSFTNIGSISGNVDLTLGSQPSSNAPSTGNTLQDQAPNSTPHTFLNQGSITGTVTVSGLAQGDSFTNTGTISGAVTLKGTLGAIQSTLANTVSPDVVNRGTLQSELKINTAGDGLVFNDATGTLVKGLTYTQPTQKDGAATSGSLALINAGTVGASTNADSKGDQASTTILKLTGSASGYATILENQSGGKIYGNVEVNGAFTSYDASNANILNAGTINGQLIVTSSGVGTIVNRGTITGGISNSAASAPAGQGEGASPTPTGLALMNSGHISGSVVAIGDGTSLSNLLYNDTGATLETVTVTGKFVGAKADMAQAKTAIYNDGSITQSLTVNASGHGTLTNQTNGSIHSLTVGADSALNIWNLGTIEAITLNNNGSSSLINSGILGPKVATEGQDPAPSTTLKLASLQNSGTINAGDLTVSGRFQNDGDVFGNVVVSGDSVQFTNTKSIQGTVTISGTVAATNTRANEAILVNSGTISGAMTITTTESVALQNTGAISGGLTFNGAGDFAYVGSENSSVTGDVTLYAANQKANTFTNQGAITGNVSVNTTAPVPPANEKPNAYRSVRVAANAPAPTLTNAGQIGGTLTVGGTDATIQNSGAIGKGIEFTGSGTLDIAVTGQGSVGDNATGSQLVISTAGAKANIDSWNTSLTKDSNGQTVLTPIKASGSGSIASVGTVTITDLGSGNLNAPIDTKNLVSGLSFNGKASSVQFSADLSGTGSLEGIYDPETGKLTPVYKADQSSAGVLSRTYAAQMMRRSVFLQGVLAEENFSSLVAGQNFTARQVYVKPYATTGRYDFSGLTTDNDTTGIMLGGNWSNGKSALTMALGYESGDASNDRYDTTLDTYYLTLNGLTHLMRWANTDVFGQLNVTASRTTIDLTNYQTATVATGSTNAASVEGAALLGLQYAINLQSYLMPTVGLGFVSANVSDYAMAGSAIADRYNPGAINLGYAALALNWKQLWTPRLETSLAGGVRVNFNTDFDVDATYGDSNLTGQYSLSRSWEYINATVTGHLAYNQDVSLSYLGVFDSTGSSHSAVVKWGYNF